MQPEHHTVLDVSSLQSCQHYPIPHEIIIVVAVIIVGGRRALSRRCLNSICSISVISLLRTYALYNCSSRLLTFMVLVAAGLIVFVCVSTYDVLRNAYPYHPARQWSITGQHHVGVVLLGGCHEVISQTTYVGKHTSRPSLCC